MKKQDELGHARCPICGGIARLRIWVNNNRQYRQIEARPICSICGLKHPISTTVCPSYEEWKKASTEEEKVLLAPAWVGWDSAWWAREEE